MIELRKTLETACKILETEKILFALIGGFALGAHGIHRATKYIDLLVDGSQKEKVKSLFLNANFKVLNESEEVLQLIGTGYLDIVFANRPLSLEMLKDSQKNSQRLFSVPVVSREGLTGLKIQAYKNDPSRELQDKADIQALLKDKSVDMIKVKTFADLFNEWNEIQRLKP